MFRLSDGEEIMTLAYFVLKPDASESADRQTDRHGHMRDRRHLTDTMASQHFSRTQLRPCNA